MGEPYTISECSGSACTINSLPIEAPFPSSEGDQGGMGMVTGTLLSITPDHGHGLSALDSYKVGTHLPIQAGTLSPVALPVMPSKWAYEPDTTLAPDRGTPLTVENGLTLDHVPVWTETKKDWLSSKQWKVHEICKVGPGIQDNSACRQPLVPLGQLEAQDLEAYWRKVRIIDEEGVDRGGQNKSMDGFFRIEDRQVTGGYRYYVYQSEINNAFDRTTAKDICTPHNKWKTPLTHQQANVLALAADLNATHLQVAEQLDDSGYYTYCHNLNADEMDRLQEVIDDWMFGWSDRDLTGAALWRASHDAQTENPYQRILIPQLEDFEEIVIPWVSFNRNHERTLLLPLTQQGNLELVDALSDLAWELRIQENYSSVLYAAGGYFSWLTFSQIGYVFVGAHESLMNGTTPSARFWRAAYQLSEASKPLVNPQSLRSIKPLEPLTGLGKYFFRNFKTFYGGLVASIGSRAAFSAYVAEMGSLGTVLGVGSLVLAGIGLAFVGYNLYTHALTHLFPIHNDEILLAEGEWGDYHFRLSIDLLYNCQRGELDPFKLGYLFAFQREWNVSYKVEDDRLCEDDYLESIVFYDE